MNRLCKVINEQTKQVEIGYEQYIDFYKSIGMIEQEVEQGWDSNWYLKGYAPQKPTEILSKEIRKQRDLILSQTDKFVLSDYPISEDELNQYKKYRQYLRNIPQQKTFPNIEILSFKDWLTTQN